MFSKTSILFVGILILGTMSLLPKDSSFVCQIGEELTYKVTWSFIRLGTLKLQLADSLIMDSTFVYHVKLYIDSNPLLFFVNMHSVYESFIDEKLQLYLFLADEKIDNVIYKTEYRFDYADSLIHINMTDMSDPTRMIKRDEPLNETILDGTTLVYYSRANASFNQQDTVTAFFSAKRGKVTINFKGKNKKVTINALKFPLETFFLDGFVHTKGIAGLTGPFKGWFAADKQRPPLKAELKVFIGHVKVELEEWKNWHPQIMNSHIKSDDPD